MTNHAAQLGILYASLAGKTKRIALQVAERLAVNTAQIVNLRDATPALVATQHTWIFCIPTYGMGELDHHTRRFFSRCDAQTFCDKRIVAIVLGDQQYHGKTFAGALAKLHTAIQQCGGKLTGTWPATDYLFEASPALDARGFFPGLVLDEVNQPERTDARLAQWLALQELDTRKETL